MDHYAVYEYNHLLRHNFISLLSSSPQVNLHRFRMKLRNDREVYYIFNEHNCAHIHDFLNNTFFRIMQGEPPSHKVIVIFDMDTKAIIRNIIEEEFQLLKNQNIDELNELGDYEFEVKYCEYSVYMIGQCMCPNYFPQQYLEHVNNYIMALNNL